jgi:hypothetical protein
MRLNFQSNNAEIDKQAFFALLIWGIILKFTADGPVIFLVFVVIIFITHDTKGTEYRTKP